jgi:hypothetical protein
MQRKSSNLARVPASSRPALPSRQGSALPPRAGLTFVELTIAMLITGIIAAAVAAFTVSTATAWRETEASQTAENMSHIACARMNNMVHEALMLGAVRPGDVDNPASTAPAAVMMWSFDGNGDGQIQTSEITLIEFDRAAGRLNLRSKRAPQEDATWTPAQFNNPSAIDVFRDRANTTRMGSRLTGVAFTVRYKSTNERPRLEYVYRTSVSGRAEKFFGSASLRSAVQPR